ncbi:MAG: NfeD family protein [Cyanobacteria bacterium P01_G01_bin.54]
MSELTLLWLMAGAILCLMELFFPTAMVEFTMGLAALLVGIISLILPSVGLQVALWMLLSIVLLLLARRWLTPRFRPVIPDEAAMGETLTEILPGTAGRVRCDGNSWRALCEDETIAIAAEQRVEVVRREGSTLIVRPIVKAAPQF